MSQSGGVLVRLLLALLVIPAIPHAFAISNNSIELVPRIEGADGDKVRTISLGQQATILIHAVNNDNLEHPFVAIVKVRNSDGVTEYLAWHSNTLSAKGTYVFGTSWAPQKEGSYEVRIFAVTDLKSPMVLSAVAVAHLEVKN